MATKKPKARRYELLAMKAGDSSFGNTRLLAQLSLDELTTIERIAKALAADDSGMLLEAVKSHVDFWEFRMSMEKPGKRGGRQ